MQTRSKTRKVNNNISSIIDNKNTDQIVKSKHINKNKSSDLLDIDNLYVLHPPILPIYEVNLNFDESVYAWRENKQQTGPGHYKYICICKTKSGFQCKNKPLNGSNTCIIHSRSR